IAGGPAIIKQFSGRRLMRTFLSAGSWLVLLVALTSQKPIEDVKKPDNAHIVDLDGVKIEFVFVGKGRFCMGSPPERKKRDKSREEQKEVTIAGDYYIGKFEVTQAQWGALMGRNPSKFSHMGEGKDSVKDIPDEEIKQFPVEQVSWEDIQGFLKKLNEREQA